MTMCVSTNALWEECKKSCDKCMFGGCWLWFWMHDYSKEDTAAALEQLSCGCIFAVKCSNSTQWIHHLYAVMTSWI